MPSVLCVAQVRQEQGDITGETGTGCYNITGETGTKCYQIISYTITGQTRTDITIAI